MPQKGNTRKVSIIESYRHHIDLLKRTKSDLEDIISMTIIHGVFVYHYINSNWSIMVRCIDTLECMTTQRPDYFLTDDYLTYFGWLLSYKSEVVHSSAIAEISETN